MISSVIETITDRLEMYFDSTYGGSAPKVVAASLMNQNNEFTLETIEKQVIVTLINLQEETFGSGFDYSNKPVHIKLTVLISVLCEDDYLEALGFLSSVIQFFQSNGTFTSDNTPQLHDDIDKIDFNILNNDLRDVSSIWNGIGAKYLPSVIYTARAITFTSSGFGFAARI